MGPIIGAAAIGAGMDILGGILGANSAKDQLREQQKFYAEMRRTQYQATVKDLKAAGLNPMMLYSGSGLSQGANVSGPSQADSINKAASGVSAKAAQAPLLSAQLAQMNSARALTDAQTEGQKIDNFIRETTYTGENYLPGLKIKPNMIIPGGLDLPAGLDPHMKGRRNATQQAADIMSRVETINQIKALTGQAATQQQVNQTMAALNKVRQEAEHLGLEEKKADAEFWRQYGNWAKNLEGAGLLVKVIEGVFRVLKR